MLTKIKDWLKSRYKVKGLMAKKGSGANSKSRSKDACRETRRGRSKQPALQPIIIPRAQHNISRNQISKHALKVLYRLKNAGYQAFLVGGGVRDMLLGMHPKDFDIATDASPEQLRKLFRNCRLIGRRFRLAHIYFGKNIIEVATFRAEHSQEHQNQAGMLLRDNVYGTIEEDAVRRDFTINALYYNIKDFSLVDYVGGLEDIKLRQLRIIGDAGVRYREDPVRMLRAVRLASKLQLTLHPDTEKPLLKMRALLKDVSSSRLFEEYLKLFLLQNIKETFDKLIAYGLYEVMFPQTQPFLQVSGAMDFLTQALLDIDQRTATHKPVSPIFLLAVILWYPFLIRLKAVGEHKITAEMRQHSFEQVMIAQRQIIMVPKRLTHVIRDIWLLQFKLLKLTVHEVVKCFKATSFRLAYDFLLLRAQAGDKEVARAAKWWRNYVEGSDQVRKGMLKELAKGKQ